MKDSLQILTSTYFLLILIWLTNGLFSNIRVFF